jgi:gp178
MNRQEAIQTLSKVGKISVSYAEDLYDSFFPKPVVPQYVADWYEEHKERFDFHLSEFLCDWYGEDHNDNSPFSVWFGENWDAIQTLVDMHRQGYTVEKEAKYTVKYLGLNPSRNYLNCNTKHDDWFLSNDEEISVIRTAHTRKELEEADFGWVFSCEGVEVKEVDDGND